ncbi:MAG TPA: alpha/beta fold hydrolase [Solirubrobacteraceae bacterium]
MELHVARRGSGEPLLMIMGLAGTHVSWGDPFLGRLEDGFDCIAFDNRGIGMSPPVSGPFTIRDLADDAAAVLDRLELESAHVLGISMGGMIAQELALAHPERIRTLTLGCTYCGGPGSALLDPADGQRLFAAWSSGDREQALKTGYELNVSEAFAAVEANYGPFREMALSVPARLPTMMLQVQAVAAHDTQSRLGEIALPTLVIHGTADRMVPFANGELLASKIPGARLEAMDGVGHMFWWERPEESAALLREHAGVSAAA